MTHMRTLVALACVALAAAGCTRIRDHKGYVSDETLISSVQPGVDNKDSVAKTLGRPTFVGQFDDNEWFYVSRDTRQLAFNAPRVSKQTVLRVAFDAAGNVANVTRTGRDKIAAIDPVNAKTPTLGRERGFFQELFGNIGAVRAPGTTGERPPQ